MYFRTSHPDRPALPVQPDTEQAGSSPVASGLLWPRLMVIAWAGGASLLLLGMLAGLLAVALLGKRATPLTDRTVLDRCDRLRERLGVQTRVQLLAGAPGAMPMTWAGLPGTSAKILLPPEAAQWTPARLEAVLLHELAHVKRRDCLTHALAWLVACFYWPNPLVWVALWRMRLERERACDDLVLTSGQRASDYAEQLLEVALSLRPSLLGTGAAIAMARRSGMEGRVMAVLDQKRSRRALSGPAVAVAAALLAAVAVPVAMVEAQQTREPEADAIDKPSVIEAETPTGTVLDADGQPAADAELVLYFMKSRWGAGNRVVERVRSDSSGRFNFSEPLAFENANGTTYTDHYVLFAHQANAGPAWTVITSDEPAGDLTLRLSEPVQQMFVVRDEQGRPLSGARVWLLGAGRPDDPDPRFREHFHGLTDIGLFTEQADEQGRVTIVGLPGTRCTFNIGAPGYANGYAWLSPSSTDVKDVTLSPAASVEGQLVTDDGQPVPDALVWFAADWNYHWFTWARTDAQGRFRHRQLVGQGGSWTKGGGNGRYKVTIEHPDYTAREQEVQVEPGEHVEGLSLTAIEGTPLAVRVLEAETDQPIRGARVQGFVDSGRLNGYTDAKGWYRTRVAPGEITVFLSSPPEGTYWRSDPQQRKPSTSLTSGDEAVEVVLHTPTRLQSVIDVTGRVVTPEGVPAAGLAIVTANRQRMVTAGFSGSGKAYTATDDDGRFTLEGVPTDDALFLYGLTDDRRLALGATIGPERLAEPHRLTLQPTTQAEVTIIDIDGTPRADYRMRMKVSRWGNGLLRADWRIVTTNANGRLTLDGVVPGQAYFLLDARTTTSENGWYEHPHQVAILAPTDQPAEEPVQIVMSDKLALQLRDADEQRIPIAAIRRLEVIRPDRNNWVNPNVEIVGRMDGGWTLIQRSALNWSPPEQRVRLIGTTKGGEVFHAESTLPAEPSKRLIFSLERSEQDLAEEAKARRLHGEAWRLWREGQYAQAERSFEQVVEVLPEAANAWNGLGWSRFNQGQTGEAIAAFEKTLALAPAHPAALNGLGQVRMVLGEYEAAEQPLLKAAEHGATAAWWGLAKLYLLTDQPEKALPWAEKIVAESPDNAEAQRLLEAAKAGELPDHLQQTAATRTRGRRRLETSHLSILIPRRAAVHRARSS